MVQWLKSFSGLEVITESLLSRQNLLCPWLQAQAVGINTDSHDL